MLNAASFARRLDDALMSDDFLVFKSRLYCWIHCIFSSFDKAILTPYSAILFQLSMVSTDFWIISFSQFGDRHFSNSGNSCR